MSSTRSVIAPPPFAANALTTIPPTPVAGVSYRDPIAGPASSPNGWPYSERVNSAEWNQIMFQISSLVSIIDKKGILGWSSAVDYTESSIVFGSDGVLYVWLQASGPAGAGAKDPLTNPLYWQTLSSSFAASTDGIAGSFSNLKISTTGLNAQASITANSICVKNTSDQQKVLNAVSVTPSLSASGANGLDTGTSAVSTWYSLWVIYNPSTATTAGLFSINPTSPTMPSGYTHKARVGWVRSDSNGANKFPLSMTQFGRTARYKPSAGSNLLALPKIASGAQGSLTVPTYVAISTANFVPSTAGRISLVGSHVLQTNGGYLIAPNGSYGEMGSTTNPAPMSTNASTNPHATQIGEFNLETSNIFYAGGASNTAVYCYGYEDNL